MKAKGPIKIKSAEEIAILRKAGRKLSSIMKELVRSLKSGMTTFEIDRLTGKLIDEHGVKPLQSIAQCLLSEIRRRINEHGLAAVLNENGNPQSLVARVIRGAGLTFTADRGNARRCTGAEKSQFHLVIVNGE